VAIAAGAVDARPIDAVIKLGGDVLEGDVLAAVAADIARAGANRRLVVVHGGGPQATALAYKMGLESRLVGGRRITDAATLDVMKMVVAGRLNVDLVTALRAAGVPAIGLSGSSGVIRAHRRPPQLWRYTRMIEEAVNHVDLFIAPSEFTMQKHREMGLQRPIAELPYFTSRWSLDQPTETYVSPEVLYFLFVGRLENIKGLQSLIPVFRRYRNAQLWVAGTGEYEGVLRAMAADSPNIKFLGHQSGEPLRVLYEQAVATIVPSLWYEVFGIIILESFTQKTPVIVSNRGGMPKVVTSSGGVFKCIFNFPVLEDFVADREFDGCHLPGRLPEIPPAFKEVAPVSVS
jgi:glycosyltransferase involved in cell wall biosynthesis